MAAPACSLRRTPPMCSLGGARPRGSLPGAPRPLTTRPLLRGASSSGTRPDHRWQKAQWQLQAGGGGGGGSAGGGSGGSGGGGGSDDQPGGEKATWGWKGWRDRVAVDPQFPYKIMIEQVIGVTANVLGDMATRPNWGLNELDFVFATLVVGSIINFAIVYLLAPVAAPAVAAAGAGPGLAQKLFGDYYLLKMGAPTGHCFQPGFPFSGRLFNLFYKGFIFALIGMGAGVIGTATSNGLLALRKRLDPAYSSPNTPPTVIGNASCWALHMGVSANMRYQMVNGLDMVMQGLLPPAVFRVATSFIRGANNLAGGMSFGLLVKALGVQKAGQAEPPADKQPPKKGKKK